MKQTTSHILMIAPTNFGFNEEAFITNKFQQRPNENEISNIQEMVLGEFNVFVQKLEAKGINVHVYSDLINSKTPDSIFPNNWISTHQSGELITYPMGVPNRQEERRDDIVAELINEFGYRKIDFSNHEKLSAPAFLEGTGSMIFDHQNKTVYAAISPRTDEIVFNEVANELGYKAIAFISYGKTGELIYHTNVMMCIGDKYIILGEDTIDKKHQEQVLSAVKSSGKEIIKLSNNQVYNHFAGNMLQLENGNGETILVMSQTAYDSLKPSQLERLNELNDHIIWASIPTIERIGGGSARCMLAELFLIEG